MIISTRKEALSLGHTKYFTGVHCVQGHIAFRRAKTGECLECRKKALIRWRKDNPEKVKNHNKVQYLKYPTQKHMWKIRAKNYAQRHKDKVNLKTVAYQLAKENRVPKWVNTEDMWLIQEAYALAAIRSEKFGFKWHVDHIIPLRGKIVSGLHVIENLQVIPGIENCKKANRYTV